MRSPSTILPSQPKRSDTFWHLGTTSIVKSLLPYTKGQGADPDLPKRKSLDAPIDNHTFVKPIKQCFIKNPRLMPMTRIMLTLLVGWAGQGGSIKTTVGIIAKHLGRSRRQVFRYLKDAVEEGYLTYSRTKDRIGLYTGISVWLNFPAIRFTKFKAKTKKPADKHRKPAVTYTSDTNHKNILNTKKGDELWKSLLEFGTTLGYIEKKPAPT